ncbi:SAF domain-containing protein [Fodinicola acaciae]|uniref:SAF domain-containing protein n=1 Tax=Fodinicola acaciae TaxID=2681555 RepID=UPI0013D5D4D9|nr:SAF domain-containing protein [Fodinicola acaciae]
MVVRERETFVPSSSIPTMNGKTSRLGLAVAWRRRLPWLLAGLLAVVLGIVGVLAVVSANNERRAVWAAARDLPAGHVLTPSDVRIIQVGADLNVPLVPAARRSAVVGARLATAIQAGAPLTTRQLGAPAWPAAAQGVVGVAVDVGEFPPRIQPGDHVAVLLEPPDQQTVGGADSQPSSSTSSAGTALVPEAWERVEATVIAVSLTDAPTTNGGANGDRVGRAVVTLQTSEGGAALIASAPGVRLVAVSGNGG